MADVRVLAQPAHGGGSGQGIGSLRIPLDQWGTLTFSFKGQSVQFTTAELFEIIKEDK